MALIDAVRTVHLAPALQGYLVDLAEASRRHPALLLGLSPRATLQLSRATRARAASQGRDYATPDDVKAVAEPVLSHRLMLRPDAMSRGVTGITRHPRSRQLRARPRRSLDDHPARLDSDRRCRRVLRDRPGLRPHRALRASASGIVIALLVAVISVQRRLPPLNVRRIVSPSMVSVGEPARVDIQLPTSAVKPSPYLQLWEPVGSNGGAPMQLAKLGARPSRQVPRTGCRRRVAA